MKRASLFLPFDNKAFKAVLASFLLVIIMFAVASYVPHSLPVGSDFSAIYYADLALVNGVHVYDIPQMEALALTTVNPSSDRFFMPRFPYPPWYVLSTFYLGLLPIRSAGALWFEINLVMLFLSVWFLTDGWNGRLRLISFPLALFFLPVLGALSVGQYDFPVLLGTSSLIYSLRKENVALTVLGTVLITFKPHIGVLILLSVLGWLLVSQNSFGRSALRAIVVTGVLLCILGLLADPAWFINYPKMLLNYQGEGNVMSCSECASLPVLMSRWLFDGSLATAAKIAVALLIGFTALLAVIRKPLWQSPVLTVTFSLLMTLLVSPYLYNYDFILLLVPFAVITNLQNITGRIIVILCYLAPTFAIVLYGRDGNFMLLAATLTLAVFLYLRVWRMPGGS